MYTHTTLCHLSGTTSCSSSMVNLLQMANVAHEFSTVINWHQKRAIEGSAVVIPFPGLALFGRYALAFANVAPRGMPEVARRHRHSKIFSYRSLGEFSGLRSGRHRRKSLLGPRIKERQKQQSGCQRILCRELWVSRRSADGPNLATGAMNCGRHADVATGKKAVGFRVTMDAQSVTKK